MGFHRHGMRSAAAEKGDFDWKLLTRAFGFMVPYKLSVGLSIVSVFVVTASDLAMPSLLRRAIDRDIGGGNLSGLISTCILYLGAILVNNLTTSGQIYLSGWTGQRVMFDLRERIFTHLQRLSLSFYDGREMGDTLARLTSDIDVLNELISSGLVELANTLFSLAGVVAAMVAMNLKLSLFNFAIMPLMLLVTSVFRKWMGTAYRKTREKLGDVTARIEEGVTGVRIIQSFAQEDRSSSVFRSVNEEYRMANMEAASFRSLYFPLVDVVGSVGTGLVLWLGGAAILRGDLTVGIMVAFILYLLRFFQPIRSLAMLYDEVLAGMAAAERIFELLDTEPDIVDPSQPVHLGRIDGLVEFRNVTFAYETGQPVVKNLDIVARPGETIALVGATGAGKSTTISLLCRLYDVQDGAVLVDGHDLRDIAIQSLRQQLGIVLQEGFLFSDTIRGNIRYGKLEATDEEVEASAKTVGAHEFIMRLRDGYDTEVRERGEKLSIGERQLICLARALIADPRILILDEATSSIDPYTELIIQAALLELFKGRTSFVIAHRLSTVRRADRIYVIDGGRVVEVGTHEELLARGGLYNNLYEMQFKAQEGLSVADEMGELWQGEIVLAG